MSDAPVVPGSSPPSEPHSDAEDSDSDSTSPNIVDDADMRALLRRIRALHTTDPGEGGGGASEGQAPLLPSCDLAGIAHLIASGKVRRVVCLTGAGISVSAGIPDFRSPGTGLYARLAAMGLPDPESVFSLPFFANNPRPFYELAQELFPGRAAPTPAHYFMVLLHRKGLLLRVFTQNIDSLECLAGLPPQAVVAAHGNFDSAHCIACDRDISVDLIRAAVDAREIPQCPVCGGLCKPRIVFFGEALPVAFFDCSERDLPRADLLLVMGTSLVVYPFAGLIDEVRPTTPRLLINRDKVGESSWPSSLEDLLLGGQGGSGRGFTFTPGPRCRDVFHQGDADEGVRQLCRLLGWEEELEELIAEGRRSFLAGSSPSAAGGGAGLVDVQGGGADSGGAERSESEKGQGGETAAAQGDVGAAAPTPAAGGTDLGQRRARGVDPSSPT